MWHAVPEVLHLSKYRLMSGSAAMHHACDNAIMHTCLHQLVLPPMFGESLQAAISTHDVGVLQVFQEPGLQLCSALD